MVGWMGVSVSGWVGRLVGKWESGWVDGLVM